MSESLSRVCRSSTVSHGHRIERTCGRLGCPQGIIRDGSRLTARIRRQGSLGLMGGFGLTKGAFRERLAESGRPLERWLPSRLRRRYRLNAGTDVGCAAILRLRHEFLNLGEGSTWRTQRRDELSDSDGAAHHAALVIGVQGGATVLTLTGQFLEGAAQSGDRFHLRHAGASRQRVQRAQDISVGIARLVFPLGQEVLNHTQVIQRFLAEDLIQRGIHGRFPRLGCRAPSRLGRIVGYTGVDTERRGVVVLSGFGLGSPAGFASRLLGCGTRRSGIGQVGVEIKLRASVFIIRSARSLKGLAGRVIVR